LVIIFGFRKRINGVESGESGMSEDGEEFIPV